MKARVCFRYFVNYCLGKRFLDSNSPQIPSSLICLTIFLNLRPWQSSNLKLTSLQENSDLKSDPIISLDIVRDPEIHVVKKSISWVGTNTVTFTAWKVSECGKIWTRKNSVFGHFLRSDGHTDIVSFLEKRNFCSVRGNFPSSSCAKCTCHDVCFSVFYIFIPLILWFENSHAVAVNITR